MRFAEWLIFENIKEDFNNCCFNLLSGQFDEFIEKALKTKGFIEENVDSKIIKEVWQNPIDNVISENLSDCNCRALMAQDRIPINCCSLKCIKDLMIQVRLSGIEQRKKDIKNLESLHDKQMEIESEMNSSDRDIFLIEDLEEIVKEKIKILIKIGHIRKRETFIQNFNIDDEKSMNELNKRTIQALAEKNEVPEQMKIYLNPNANKDFGTFLMKMFVKGSDIDRAGEIFQMFVKRLTKKNIKNGEATWGDFAGLKGALEDLENVECDDSILGSPQQIGKESPILNRVSKFMKANIAKSGKSGSEMYVSRKETVSSRTAKEKVINNDLGRTKAKGQLNWSRKGPENFSFYKSALNKLFNNEELTIVSREDNLRKEIIEDIFYNKSTNKDLFPIRPINNENIKLSLENYYEFLKRSTLSKVSEIPRTGPKSSSEEEDTDAAILSSLSKLKSEKGTEVLGKTEDPLKQLIGKEETELGLLNKVKNKLKSMLLKDDEEKEEALAFCIKYGLGCVDPENISITKDVFRIGKGDKLKGLSVNDVADKLSQILGRDITYQKARFLTINAENKIKSL